MAYPSQKQYELRNGRVFGGGKVLSCAPLISPNAQALVADVKACCAENPDILEWRADFLEALSDPQAAAEAAKALREAAGDVPVLFTPRHPAENGVQELNPDTKRAVIEAVCATGCVDLVDLEMRYDEEYIAEVRSITEKYGVKLVLSCHDFSGMPDWEDIEAKLRRAERLGADINKLALMPKNYHDVAVFCKNIVNAKQTWMKNPVINSLMGDIGAVTRFAGNLGSDMSFVAVTAVSGPGQMHISDYRILNELLG